MTQARLVWIAIAFLVMLASALWATARPAGEFGGLDARLAAAADDVGHGGRINLAEMTDFEWDEAHIFGAYTTATEVEAQLDGWSPLSPAGRLVFGDLFLGYDGHQLLVFRRDGAIVAWTVLNQDQLSQTYIEFDPGILPRAASPQDSVFVVRRFGVEGWSLQPG